MDQFPQNPAEPEETPAAEIPDTDENSDLTADTTEIQDIPADTPDIPAPAAEPDDADAQAIAAALELIRERNTAQPGNMFTEPAPDTEAAEEQPQRHLALRITALFFALLVLSFAVFCIIWDIRKGTASNKSKGEHVSVEIIQQTHPDAGSAGADETGRYTTEGIAETVMPSIVQIYTYADGKSVGSGSGIILSADGYIATNAHVVADADVYTVRFFNSTDDDKQVDAELIGHDTKTDLAVIKTNVSGLKPAVFGNSDQVKLGEAVCALGNPAGLSGSISTGIISGMNRKVRASSNVYEMDCFQTDAAISPGNSGGALVNMYGQVIGITSSKYASSMMFGSTAYEGLGFAITVNAALPIIKELTEQGYVSGRVRVGISFLENEAALKKIREEAEEADKEPVIPKELEGKGVRIMGIDEDSDLKNTILEVGDWILTMNGREVSDYDSLNEALNGCVGGDSVHCRCGRIQEDGTLKTFEIDFRLLEDHSGEY